MPEYTYLLETRLSVHQKNALLQVREAAREAGLTVFLAGGAVRDLTTGSSVRDLDFVVQGNALELEHALGARGGELWGRHEASRTLYLWFPGSVRIEVASARSEHYPKPGQPEYTWNSIIDDLFRRDFTANAMALSLNEGSYGLLLDPLNGVADIEGRQLRLVSNYGFIEDPSRLIRAARLIYRLGWQLEERTATRYENARESETLEAMSPFLRGYEIEKIAAEEEALGVMQALEAAGWLEKLVPGWSTASADVPALENLHKNRIQLLMQGIAPDLTAVHLEVLTAKMKPEAREALSSMLARTGLREQWQNLETAAKEFNRRLLSKEAAVPSEAWKLFHNAQAEPILWLAHTRKAPALEAKFKDLFTVWPEAAKKVPVALMLEMRINPELPNYADILHAMFLRQIDGSLETEEQIRAFLEPYSPPAPPPPVTLRRSRSKKGEKGRRKSAAREEEDLDEESEEIDRSHDEDEEAAEDEEAEDAEDAEAEDEEELPAPVAVSANRQVVAPQPQRATVKNNKDTAAGKPRPEMAEKIAEKPEEHPTAPVKATKSPADKTAPAHKAPAHAAAQKKAVAGPAPGKSDLHAKTPAASPAKASPAPAPAKTSAAKTVAKSVPHAPVAATRVAKQPAEPAKKTAAAPHKTAAKQVPARTSGVAPAKKGAPAKKPVPAKQPAKKASKPRTKQAAKHSGKPAPKRPAH